MISSDDPSHFSYFFFCALQTTHVEMLTALLLEMHDVQILTWLHVPPFSQKLSRELCIVLLVL